MCGIVGVISAQGMRVEQDDFISQALEVGQLRGRHSTGLMYGQRRDTSDSRFIKQAITGSDFVATPELKRVLQASGSYGWMIGHNRWATMGAHTTENAHPFIRDNITLVHNGTLGYGWRAGMPNDVNVDSDSIAVRLSREPAKDVLESIDGAFALVWHDASDGTLHVARNTQRPMAMCYDSGGEYLYMASEGMMLEWLMARNSIKPHADGPLNLEVGDHMIFSPGTGKEGLIPTVESFIPFVPPRKTTYSYAGSSSQATKSIATAIDSCPYVLPSKGQELLFSCEGDKSYVAYSNTSKHGYLVLNSMHWDEESTSVQLRLIGRTEGTNAFYEGDFKGHVSSVYWDRLVNKWVVSINFPTISVLNPATDFNDFFLLEEREVKKDTGKKPRVKATAVAKLTLDKNDKSAVSVVDEDVGTKAAELVSDSDDEKKKKQWRTLH